MQDAFRSVLFFWSVASLGFLSTIEDFGMTDVHRPRKKGVIPTAGVVFSDGTAFELIRNHSACSKLELLKWKGEALESGPRVHHAGRTYAPLAIEASVANMLRLPSRVSPQETTRELFAATQKLFHSHLIQPDETITKLVFSVFASWMSGALPMSPLVWIVTPVGSPKWPVLTLLNLVCRRPLPLVGLGRSSLRSLPMALGPTLLLNEPEPRPTMLRALHSSSRRNSYVSSGRKVIDLFGPKIILSQSLPLAAPDWSDTLRVVLSLTAGKLAPLDQNLQEEIGEEFQARYLGYFLRNFRNVRLPEFDVTRLSLPTQDLALALGAAVVGDEKIQARILPTLEVQDEEFRSERSTTLEAVLIEALLHFEGRQTEVLASHLAKFVNGIRTGRDDSTEISPESVGWALKRLGIPTERLSSAGNGVKLTDSTLRLVHELGHSFDVRAFDADLRKD